MSLLLMFLIYAIAAFGILLSTKNSLTHAAAEGARSALSVSDLPNVVGNTPNDRRVAQAKATVQKDLQAVLGSNYNAGDVDATIANCSATDTNQCITVTITYPWSTRPLVPTAPGMGLAMPNTLKATAIVRIS